MKNKITKVLALMAVVLVANFTQVHAQNANQERNQYKKEYNKVRTPEEKAQKFVDVYAKKLDLSDQQKKEIYNIKLKEITESQSIHSKKKELKSQSFENIKKTLTAEQQKSLEEMKGNSSKYYNGKKECCSKMGNKDGVKECCQKGHGDKSNNKYRHKGKSPSRGSK